MDYDQTRIAELIRRAREGDSAALGELLDRHRGYLKILAKRAFDGRHLGQIDTSDVVQRTCLSVHKAIGEFQGQTENQFLAWLRKIRENNVRNALRDYFAQKRGADRKDPRSIDELESLVADASQTAPSQRVLRDEQAVQLAAELDRLPDDQREAVRLRYIEGYSLAEVGEILGRSDKAASALILRGLAVLRKRLRLDSSRSSLS